MSLLGTGSYLLELDENGRAYPGNLEIIHARYLIACDGAHSWTRRQLQVPTEAKSEPSTWGVIDIVPVTDFRMRSLPMDTAVY